MDLLELEQRFGTQRKCEEFLKSKRWPDGVTCPKCSAKRPYWIRTVRLWHCRECGYRFSLTSGTIFHRSRTPLRKWFIAIYLMCTAKKGVPAKQLERALGVTYKTAWRMSHQIRQAMKHADFEDKLAGIVEADDAYVGGKRSGGKRGRGAPGKTIVVGLKQRGGAIKAVVVPNLKADTLKAVLHGSVRLDAEMLCTDELKSYGKAAKDYTHEQVKHAETYVNGNVHTMGVENFWSLFKRAVIGVYHRVSSKHLQAYLDEFVFRFNNRKNPDIFGAVLAGCEVGR